MDTGQPLTPILYRACEAVGQVMELWGFKRIHGMVWMYIFLQPHPVSAQEIRTALGISSGLVSMTLAELLHWDVVHRKSAPGDRKDYYTAETNIGRPIMKVLREREYYQIDVMLNVLREVQASFDPAGDPAKEFAARQLNTLIQLGELGQSLFSNFLEAGALLLRGTGAWQQAPERMGHLLLALKRFLAKESSAVKGVSSES